MRVWGVGSGAWARLLVATGLLVACGDGSPRGTASGRASQQAGSSSAPGSGSTTPDTPRPTPDPCPPDGTWRPCSVEKRLEMAGLVPVKEEEGVRERPLSVPGTRYTLGAASLVLFYYESPAARAADEARLDTVRFIDPYRPLSARREATRIGSANLLAILHSLNDHQRERIGDALTAGPPQRAP